MKKTLFVLAASALLLLTACDPTISSSSSALGSSSGQPSSTTGSSSLPPGPTIEEEVEREKILDFINKARTANNYTYGYLGSDGSLVSPMVLTDDYIVDLNGTTATVALPSFEKDGEKLLYSVEKKNDKYEVLNALSYTDDEGVTSPYHSTTELNYLNLLTREDVNFGADDLLLQSDYFYIEDANVITIFASMFGLGNYTSYIQRAYIRPVKGDELQIGFTPNFKDEDGSVSTMIDATIGIITHVGTSTHEGIESFLSSFSMSNEHLSTENLSFMKENILTYEASLYRYLDENIDAIYAKEERTLDYKNNRASVLDYKNGAEELYTYKKGEQGELLEEYLSPTNTYETFYTGEKFDAFLPTLEDLDLEAFRKVDATTYRYFGYQYQNLVSSFTGDPDGMGVVINMEAKVDEEGNLLSIHADSREVLLAEQGVFHFEMDLIFKESKVIDEITPYENVEDSKIEIALEKFNSTAGYQITTYNIANETITSTLTVKDNIALWDKVVINTAPGSTNEYYHTYSGFVYQEGSGVAPFVVEENEEEQLVARIYDDVDSSYTSIDDYIGLGKIAPEVFSLENDGSLTLRKNVRKIEEILPLGPNGDFLIEGTLRFTFDEETSSFTGYQYKNTITAEDKALISYGNDLPTNIDFSSLGGAFVAPTTWEEAVPSVYEALATTSWMEGYENTVPFLYNAELNDYWYLGNKGYTEIIISNNYSYLGSTLFDEYVEQYKALLLENGFSLGEYNRYGKEGLPYVVVVNYSEGSTIDIRVQNKVVYPFLPLE